MHNRRRPLAISTIPLLIALCWLLIPAVNSPQDKQDDELVLPEGTAFNVITTREISSKTAGLGTNLNFKIEQDVLVKGQVVIRKDTVAKGWVISSNRFGIQVESTQTVDGQALKLRALKSQGSDRTLSSGAFDVISGLFVLREGSDEKITEGTRLSVQVAEEKYFRVDDSTLVTIYPPGKVAQAKGKVAAATGLEGFAIVYAYRPKQFGRGIIELPVFRDNLELARMNNGTYFALKLAPGKHRLHNGDPNKGYFIEVEAGQIYYFRTGFETWSNKEKLKLEDAEKAVPEIMKLKFIGSDHILDIINVVDLPPRPPKP